jgi:hypothetical protein
MQLNNYENFSVTALLGPGIKDALQKCCQANGHYGFYYGSELNISSPGQ